MAVAIILVSTAYATTWYVRADGGTRYTAARITAGLTGQCDGQADAAYPGFGVNQHCAFNDARFLWDDQTYGNSGWVIAGGDTVILDNTATWRVGFQGNGSSTDPWCYGGGGAQSCVMPIIPAGTAGHPTQILGRNYANCNVAANKPDVTKTTKLWGGHGVGVVLNLYGAQYVTAECLDISSFNPQCQLQGSPQANPCSKSAPIDDYASDGILTSNTSGNLALQDIYVHGTNSRGIHGQQGTAMTANRVWISVTPQTGWDFDDGTASGTGTFTLTNSIIEWSGCQQKASQPYYGPATDAQTAADITYCFSQGSGNVIGDGIGTPGSTGFSVYLDRDTFRWNTQDGEDFGHADTGSFTLSITNSLSYGNLAGTFKWGWAYSNIIFENNIGRADCLRMLNPLPGADSTVSQYLSDGCRAGDMLSFNFQPGTQALFANNTMVGYAPTSFDYACVASSSTNCGGTVWTLRNNLLLGYDNSATYSAGGQAGGVGGFCGASCNGHTGPTNGNQGGVIGTINRDHNQFYGWRGSCIANTQTADSTSGVSANESCLNPAFVGEPSSFGAYSTLDSFNYALAAGSPAIHAGVAVTGLTTDYAGNLRPNPPSLGALEYLAGLGHALFNGVAIIKGVFVSH